MLKKNPLIPLLSSGLGGALVSATSTSPFGRTWSHRGWTRSRAKAATAVPSAAMGLAPCGQPVALTTCTSGISALLGAGRVGSGPVPAETGSFAEEAHPVIPTTSRHRQAILFAGWSMATSCSRLQQESSLCRRGFDAAGPQLDRPQAWIYGAQFWKLHRQRSVQ